MEVESQHCDTKDMLYTVKSEKIFIHDSRVQHPVQSSVRGTLRVPQTWLIWLTGLFWWDVWTEIKKDLDWSLTSHIRPILYSME